MKKSPCVFVIFYYKAGKIINTAIIETYSIAFDSIVRAAAIKKEVIYDDYIPAFIHP